MVYAQNDRAIRAFIHSMQTLTPEEFDEGVASALRHRPNYFEELDAASAVVVTTLARIPVLDHSLTEAKADLSTVLNSIPWLTDHDYEPDVTRSSLQALGALIVLTGENNVELIARFRPFRYSHVVLPIAWSEDPRA